MESKKLDTVSVKVGDEMSQELKQYLSKWGKLCLWEGALYQHGNQIIQDHNKLQLVVKQEYRWEAMHGAHNDVGHLSLEWMLDTLWNQVYWPNLETDATHHIWTFEQCLRFKGRQDKEELYPLLATYPLELVHMDFLTIENPCTDVMWTFWS